MVAVLPVVASPPTLLPPPMEFAATDPVVAAPPEPELVLSELELLELALELELTDVAREPLVPVTALLDDPLLDEVCPALPPALVPLVGAPVSTAFFELSPQAQRKAGANESSKPRRRDFMGDAPFAKINHAVVASTLWSRAHRFRCLRTRTRQKSGARAGVTKHGRFSRELPCSAPMHAPIPCARPTKRPAPLSRLK